ncbi:MAG TPA: hypothetical protein VGO61_04715 [Steroidobacteraceae bacterium]|jgi:hypothetical protein|nr:hypothetical protein [Steroidobacteraceae bacterium]
MPTFRRMLLGWLAAAALPLSAMAAEGARNDFECDTPAGHFSSWNRTVSSGAIEISGKVVLNEVREDKKWTTVANVLLRHGKDRAGRFGIRFYTDKETSNLLYIELLKVGGRAPIGTGSTRHSKKPIAFSLRLNASGLLTAAVAGSEATTQLVDFKPDSFEINCSTGDFDFTDVTVSEK